MKVRHNLVQIVKLLNQQIEDVRYEIAVFKQKGGRLASLLDEGPGGHLDQDQMMD